LGALLGYDRALIVPDKASDTAKGPVEFKGPAI
jgi:hypothetical protein